MEPRPDIFDDLDGGLAALRSAFADASPPEATDRAVAAAIDRAKRRANRATARPGFPDRWFAWPLALVASIGLIAVAVRHMPAGEIASVVPSAQASAPPRFIPVVPVAEIERSGDAWVVPARLPRMALAQLGLPVDPAHADDAIETELLVRPDGGVLAVRFLN